MNRLPFRTSTNATGLRILAWLLLATCIAFAFPESSDAAGRKFKPPAPQGSFTDHFSSYDTARWYKADGWKNGAPFDNGWAADHITFSEGVMHIRLDDQPMLGEPYTSGNYQSTGFYGYGCYEARFKPVNSSGVVSSFFTFAGPYDNGGNGQHNEIDIEFLGGNTTRFQTNYWTNDDAYAGGHEHIVYLGFDASQAFHRYGFKWTASGIEWYVDGQLVHQVYDTPSDPTPKSVDSLQKIMMNVWPVDSTASGWAGTFVYPGSALEGHYDWVRYIAGEQCSLESEPEAPPPPLQGEPSEIHVQNILMALSKRGDQVIAQVLITNGLGQAQPDVVVDAAWSGLISGGDTRRTTNSEGVATFYSARSRNSGTVSFCVTGITGLGLTFSLLLRIPKHAMPSENSWPCAPRDSYFVLKNQ